MPKKNMPEHGSMGELAPGPSFLPWTHPVPPRLCAHVCGGSSSDGQALFTLQIPLPSPKPPLREFALLSFILGINSILLILSVWENKKCFPAGLQSRNTQGNI